MSIDRNNLKKHLIEEGIELLKNKTSEQFSMREVARIVGVSHNAAYKHFKNKEELLSEIAVISFNILTQNLTHNKITNTDPIKILKNAMKEYIEFGIAHPSEYSIMYSSSLRSLNSITRVEKAGRDLSKLFEHLLRQCIANGTEQNTIQLHVISLLSLGNGLINLILCGPLRKAQTDEKFRESLIHHLTKDILYGIV